MELDLVLVVGAVTLVSVGLLCAVLLSERRRHRAERADELTARMVEMEFRKAFGDTLPAIDPYPRERSRVDAESARRPGKRSNWEPGRVRPQG